MQVLLSAHILLNCKKTKTKLKKWPPKMSTGSIKQSRTLTYIGNNSGVTCTQYLWISSEL